MSTAAKSRQDSTQPWALVTGASRRIGAAIARRLHERGCGLIIHYDRSVEEAKTLAFELNEARPDSAYLAQANLLDESGPESLASQVRSLTPELALLVNNASRFYATQPGEVTAGEWKELMGSNARAPYFLVQSLLPELRGGSIVNILDIHARRPMRGHSVYCMAKAALEMMTLALARDLGPDIRVNGVSPGAILWPEDEPGEDEKSAILSRVVMGRMGEPVDIADAVAWLGLDAAYVTGQVLAVDGGRSLNI